MGGRSSTQHTTEGGALTFAGMLDTRGGGFTSVRADFAGGLKSDALRVRFRGDGKTYKVLLSNGQGGGPWSNNPSWQHDLPTKLGEEHCRPTSRTCALLRRPARAQPVPWPGRILPTAQVGFSRLCIERTPNPESPSCRRYGGKRLIESAREDNLRVTQAPIHHGLTTDAPNLLTGRGLGGHERRHRRSRLPRQNSRHCQNTCPVTTNLVQQILVVGFTSGSSSSKSSAFCSFEVPNFSSSSNWRPHLSSFTRTAPFFLLSLSTVAQRPIP